MENVKKMALVDPQVLELLKSPKHRNTPAEESMDTLDGEMKNILNNHRLSTDEKVKLYNQTLGKFVKVQTDYRHKPIKVELNTKKELNPTPNLSPPEAGSVIVEDANDDLIQSVPKTMQKRARILIEKLKNSNEIGWNPKGEITVKGNLIKNSNISDLVNDALRKRKHFNPRGWEDFAHVLRQVNAPQDIVRNQDRWAFMYGAPPAARNPTNKRRVVSRPRWLRY